MIRVLICDDHQIVRQGIKQILADASDLALAGEAASGPEAIARVRAGGIDVVLMDIAMPQRDGLDVLKQLQGRVPEAAGADAVAPTPTASTRCAASSSARPAT